MCLVQGTTVPGKFQRFFCPELRAKLLQFTAALQNAVLAALRHQVRVLCQSCTVIRPVAQKVYPVRSLIIIGR